MFSRQRLWIETAAALLSAAICILTFAEPTWLELLFDEAADGGDGSLEAAVAIGLSLLATVYFVRVAWREWHRRPASSASRAR